MFKSWKWIEQFEGIEQWFKYLEQPACRGFHPQKKILHRESVPETMPSTLSNSCGMIQDNCLAYKKSRKKQTLQTECCL